MGLSDIPFSENPRAEETHLPCKKRGGASLKGVDSDTWALGLAYPGESGVVSETLAQGIKPTQQREKPCMLSSK